MSAAVWLQARKPARWTSEHAMLRIFPRFGEVEPPAKRARISLVGHSWKLASTTPMENGTLWEPHHLEFVVEDGRSLVRCNGGAAHGLWSEHGDTLTLTYHYNSVEQHAKTSTFRRIAGACAYLQTTGSPP